MRTNVKNDLQMSPYKMRKRQYLIPAQKHKRLERERFLYGTGVELKTDTAQREIVFYNRKLFTIEATVNNHSYAKFSEDIDDSVRTVYRRQKPSSLMGNQSINLGSRL